MSQFLDQLSAWWRFGSVAFLAALAYLLMRFIVPCITRRTRLEIDDIILGILTIPVPVIGFLAANLEWTLPRAGLVAPWPDAVHKTVWILITLVSSYSVWRVLSQAVTRAAERHAKVTASNLDDVLVPLLCRRILPLVLMVAAAVAILAQLGIHLSSVLTVLGGLSFLLIFLFQEPLSNLFGGVYLVIDVPFRYGDLIILEDDKTYQVQEIGARVTKLYSTDRHTVAYVPNSKLAGQRLINLTRPNVELRMQMQIGVAYETKDLDKVEKLLVRAANAHPHVLGDPRQKHDAMQEKLTKLVSAEQKLADQSGRDAAVRFRVEMDRLAVENDVRETGEDLLRRTKVLERFVAGAEANGLSRTERAAVAAELGRIRPRVAELQRKLTIWVHLVGYLDSSYRVAGPVEPPIVSELVKRLPSVDELERWRQQRAHPEAIEGDLLQRRLLSVLGALPNVDREFYLGGSEVWSQFSRWTPGGDGETQERALAKWLAEQPSWSTFEDYYDLYATWHKTVRDLLARFDGCEARAARAHGAGEFTLDARVHEIAELLRQNFLLRTAGWQTPDADFVGFGASSLDFRLEFFIDDLIRSHFGRVDDVFAELGLDIVGAFAEAGIEIPYPQVDVGMRGDWLTRGLRALRERDE